MISRVVDVLEIVGHDVGDMQIDDPVHQIEADETNGEHDARILVDVGRCETPQFVEVFARRDHDGRGFFVDPGAVDHHIVDDGLAADRRRHRSRHVVRRIRIVMRHCFAVRLHQETDLLFVNEKIQFSNTES